MKTITRNGSNVSIYLFDDATYVDIQADKTIVGNPVQFIIDDCNDSNTTLYTDVTDPGDWQGWKYLYTTADGWELNPNWPPFIPPNDPVQGSN